VRTAAEASGSGSSSCSDGGIGVGNNGSGGDARNIPRYPDSASDGHQPEMQVGAQDRRSVRRALVRHRL